MSPRVSDRTSCARAGPARPASADSPRAVIANLRQRRLRVATSLLLLVRGTPCGSGPRAGGKARPVPERHGPQMVDGTSLTVQGPGSPGPGVLGCGLLPEGRG